MPLPGGAADKIGNRYELWWTAVQVLTVLRGEWDSIRIEEPGEDKAEFILSRDGVRSFHQAKRSAPEGKWTLAELAAPKVGVLQSIERILRDPAARYVFVSSSDTRDLAELTERARASESFEEFTDVFISSKEQGDRLARLRKYCSDCDQATARDYLRRIEIRTLDEQSLKEQTILGAQTLFLAAPGSVCSEIRSYLLDSVHKTLTRQSIIEHLVTAGYSLRQIITLDQAKPRVDEVTQNYLATTRSRLIQANLVSRDLTSSLLANIEAAGSDYVLTGRAGTGKTGCVIELVEKLQADGIPVLAFRLDRIDLVSSTTELGRNLGLQESPALVLAAAAETRRAAVLIIDQLDSISTTSGRTTGFFDTVEGLLKEARAFRQRMAFHIVVVCREFDWKNDYRLRKLVGAAHNHLPIGDFKRDQVLDILTSAGYAVDSLPARTIDLLCLPQNLSLFLESSFPTDIALNTTIDLYEHYWKSKRRAVSERAAPSQDYWNAAIQILVDGMTESQQLSIRQEKLDPIPSDYVEQMISEGVITLSGNRIGFGHESFFDYCFSRQFVATSQSLVDFLLAQEQHLFRRAQVRQVLQYLHEDEPTRFCQELEQLVQHQAVRIHLKDLALSVAANSAEISEPEWNLWWSLITPHLEAVRRGQTSDVVSTLAWKHFFVSIALFRWGLQRGVVKSWVESENSLIVDLVLSYLRMHEGRFSADVTAILRPFKGNPAWRERIVWFMQLIDLGGSQEMFELFVDLMRDGSLDEARGVVAVNSTFWNLVYGLADKNPERMCKIVGAWLGRRLAIARQAADDARIISGRGEHFADEPISKAARSTPRSFIENVLPIMVEIAAYAIYPEQELPYKDSVWPYLMLREHGQDAHDAALRCLFTALEEVSACDPEWLRVFVDLLQHQNTYIANALLLCIFAGNGDHFGHEAVELLSRQTWRFQSGMSNNSQWFAQKAITSISTHCSANDLSTLESAILRYVAPWEKGKRGYKFHGAARFNLVAAIPPDRRSRQIERLFGELERKFHQPDGKPQGAKAVWGGSPISEDKLAKMNDRAILAAITHYSASTRPQTHLHFFRGGNLDLARAIGAAAVKDPGRYANLALRLPSNASPEYLSEILRALEKTPLDSTQKLQVATKAFEDRPEDCGREIADLLGAIEDPLPDDSLEQLSWLALHSKDPKKDSEERAESGEPEKERDPFSEGINTTRGRAALAIGKLINLDPVYADRFEETLHAFTSEKSEAVLTCIAFTFRALAVRDYVEAWTLFYQCVAHAPTLPCCQYGFDLIRIGLRNHYALLRPTVERLSASSSPRIAEAGAQLACIAALTNLDALEIADKAAVGDDTQRLIAARVASANLGVEEFRPWCEPHLLRFFNDTDKEVRDVSGECFRRIEGQQMESFGALIEAYCNSEAFAENSHTLLYTLEESVERLPGVVCTACERFLQRFGPEARDFGTSRAADGFTVSKLIFRVYQQHQRDQWTPRSLDVIDRLCLENVGEVFTQLQEFDR